MRNNMKTKAVIMKDVYAMGYLHGWTDSKCNRPYNPVEDAGRSAAYADRPCPCEQPNRATHASDDYKGHQLRGLSKLAKAAHTSERWTIEKIEAIMRTDPSTWKSALVFELNRAAHASEQSGDTKRLDWLIGNWHFSALYGAGVTREKIDAAMSQTNEPNDWFTPISLTSNDL